MDIKTLMEQIQQGSVKSVSIEGDKLDVEFDHAGSKKIVARWVVPAHQVDDVPF